MAVIVGALIIDALLIGLGALMRTAEYDPNPVFGYRTTRSMQSPEAWAYANRKSGSLMVVVGLMGLAVALIVAALAAATPLASTDTGSMVATCVSMGLPLAGVLIATALVERDLKKRFPLAGAETPKGVAETQANNVGANGSGEVARSRTVWLGTSQKAIFGVLCVLPLVIAACSFFVLPDIIAVHFDAAGADGWAPKTQVFLFAAILVASNAALIFAYRTFLRAQTRPAVPSVRSVPFLAFSACMLASSCAVLYVIAYNLA
ncbi:SdpI family protein [Raoultibacter phocaeensis]|uniref:SdpI family protein n=1 Tax=Raoultibacter phocaeensis TaxID=2479841 RepID=UPI00111A7EC5|nr:SdpI family protein [Raoultibacter phocaeensis]